MTLRKFDPLLDGPPFEVTSLSLTPALVAYLDELRERAGYGGARQRSAFYRQLLVAGARLLEAELAADASKRKR